ncbi:hypothetical protein PoB_003153100 [Plakobranchus ocellatus]|uniref:Uncharacterized protein n=1 Tax=Plakobranchus ocellatus TaxID=259542 RepID=A0AAV4AEF2_9GAST|nr:hypothetical protein PoB_003153100 [Plakobranchus ocellatus]
MKYEFKRRRRRKKKKRRTRRRTFEKCFFSPRAAASGKRPREQTGLLTMPDFGPEILDRGEFHCAWPSLARPSLDQTWPCYCFNLPQRDI